MFVRIARVLLGGCVLAWLLTATAYLVGFGTGGAESLPPAPINLMIFSGLSTLTVAVLALHLDARRDERERARDESLAAIETQRAEADAARDERLATVAARFTALAEAIRDWERLRDHRDNAHDERLATIAAQVATIAGAMRARVVGAAAAAGPTAELPMASPSSAVGWTPQMEADLRDILGSGDDDPH